MQLELQERPLPVPDHDQVLVKILAVGVCGSDVHFYREGEVGGFIASQPLVLGHEAGGEIVAVGSAVDSARIGERVSIEPQRPSPTSAESLRGEYNLDPNMLFYSAPGTDGAFQEYQTIQSHFAFKIGSDVSDDAAGLMEPLSCAIAAARKARLSVGDRVLITGAGPIGLCCLQVAVASGARTVTVSDPSAFRRNAALRLGASAVVDPSDGDIRQFDLGVDVFIDAAGVTSAIHDGLPNTRPGGSAVLVGTGDLEVPMPIPLLQNKEITVAGVFRYNNTWPTAIGLVENRQVDLDSLVTNRYGLGEVAEALSSTVLPGTIKSVVNPQK